MDKFNEKISQYLKNLEDLRDRKLLPSGGEYEKEKYERLEEILLPVIRTILNTQLDKDNYFQELGEYLFGDAPEIISLSSLESDKLEVKITVPGEAKYEFNGIVGEFARKIVNLQSSKTTTP